MIRIPRFARSLSLLLSIISAVVLIVALVLSGTRRELAHTQATSADNPPVAMEQLLIIEDLIRQATVGVPHMDGQEHFENEMATLKRVDEVLEPITQPRILYAMAILLYEGYESEFMETPRDRLLFMAREAIVYHLSKLGTQEAYDYFRRLHAHYGTDGGESLKYKGLNEQYFHHLHD